MDILNPEQAGNVVNYYLIYVYPYEDHWGTYYSTKLYRPSHIRNHFRHVLDKNVCDVEVWSPVTKGKNRRMLRRI